jgi:acyl-CoA reductase-like NAD-dependent aldehyde dehydrogenase
MLVDGQLVSGEATVPIINPATGAAVADVPQATLAQLDEAVAAARRSAGNWAADPQARSAVLAAMAGIIAENRETLAQLISLENGLPFKVTQDEVGAAALFLKYRSRQADHVDRIHDDERQRVEVIRRPVGVVGAIIPWNAPMMIACEKIGTAFAAGDTVVLKPSPLAPLALLLLGELLREAVPAGVLSILAGGDDLGEAMVAHPGIGMISFTGSTAAGRAIMAGAAPTLKRLSLELGGNDAAIVLGDVDVARTAAKLFFGAFYRGGQVCAAIKRLYVHRSIHDPLVAALKQIAEANVLGDPFDEGVTMGPLSNRQQFDRVRHLVEASLACGGTLVTGGRALDRPGFFFSPTIVTGLAADNPLVTEEQFGPALPVIAFDTIEEAIAAANATDMGLGGSVWTDDIEQGVAIARRLESGSAWVNRHGMVMPDTPFGGMKQSGIGRANGQAGFDSYSELQTISVALPRK